MAKILKVDGKPFNIQLYCESCKILFQVDNHKTDLRRRKTYRTVPVPYGFENEVSEIKYLGYCPHCNEEIVLSDSEVDEIPELLRPDIPLVN